MLRILDWRSEIGQSPDRPCFMALGISRGRRIAPDVVGLKPATIADRIIAGADGKRRWAPSGTTAKRYGTKFTAKVGRLVGTEKGGLDG